MSISNAIKEAVREVVKEEVHELKEALAVLSGHRATDEFWPVKKAAKVAGVSEWTIREWIRRGRLRSYGAGRVLRLKRSEFENFLSARNCEAASTVDPDDLATQLLGRRKAQERR